MELEVLVQRQASPADRPWTQRFSYAGDGALTVADWLTECNRTQAKQDRIAWACGCLEKKCGACAMRINGTPALACSVFLKDAARHGQLRLEPLRKFPLVRDLITDRSALFETLKEMKVWTEEKDGSDFSWDRALQYQAGQCLQCGCCLEVCPNFCTGSRFAGAAALAEAYRAMEQSAPSDHRDEMKRAYRKRFFAGCGQALSCQSVCPMHLPLDQIQARANGQP